VPEMNPNHTVCVLKTQEGKEVGKIPANHRNASDYIQSHALAHKCMKVDYVEDADFCQVYRMMNS
jgi:hypothetical protein